MQKYEIHMPCETELTRYRIEVDDDYYYCLDANDSDDRMIMAELERGQTIAYLVIKEILPANRICWLVQDSIGGILEDASTPLDTVLRRAMIDHFDETVKTEE